MEIRRFNKNDWYTFAGAEKFEDGTDPFIAESDSFTIIGDPNGIEIGCSSYELPLNTLEFRIPQKPDTVYSFLSMIAKITEDYEEDDRLLQLLSSVEIF